jgi:V8-like Glu-specific endopeptidase
MIEYVVPAIENLPVKKSKWSEFSSSLLIEVTRDHKLFTSSAVLIRRNVLLTAAHSVENIEKGYVHLSHKYGQDNMRIGFKKVIIHSGYDKSVSNFENDIALIILDSNLPKSFKPASLDLLCEIDNLEVDRIGFGGRNGINTRTWTNPLAQEKIENTIILKDELSVIGDSGGPIYSKNGLVGIHSTLEGDNKAYAVYVPAYKDWIDSYVPIKEVLN